MPSKHINTQTNINYHLTPQKALYQPLIIFDNGIKIKQNIKNIWSDLQ